MNKLFVSAIMLLAFFARGFAQDDSTLANRGDALMDLYTVIHAHDSVCVSESYSASDTATRELVEFGLGIKVFAPNLYFNRLYYAPSFDDTLRNRITFQNAQFKTVVLSEDSAILIYDKDPEINITGLPLLNPVFNDVYLKDIFTTVISDSVKKLTILFNPGIRYNRLELFFSPVDYRLKSMHYFSDEVRYGNEEDSVGVHYICLRIFSISPATITFLATIDYYSIDKYFYKNEDGFFPQPEYAGYTLTTVFNHD